MSTFADDIDWEEDQEDIADDWRLAVGESLSVLWREVDETRPRRPPQTRLTVRLDADLIAWFRRRGGGYQRCMNDALRAFMVACTEASFKRRP